MQRSEIVADGFEAVEACFRRITERDGHGSAFAAYVEGRPVVDVWGGYGAQPDQPWQADNVCVVASGSKGVAATAVLLLVERGVLDLDAPVARYWPEFAAAGKGSITVGQVMSHTAGLPGISTALTAADVTEPVAQRIEALLAAQAPITPVGEPSYHAITYGWLVNAIVRRVDGRTVGTVIAEDIAGPLGLDLSIGSPAERIARAVPLVRSDDFQFGALLGNAEPDPRLAAVYGNPTLDWTDPAVLAAEVPGANCISDARSLARLYGCLAQGGVIDGRRLLNASTVSMGLRQRSVGQDPLSGRLLRFGVGFELNPNPSFLGPPVDAFGHTGAGGSAHGAWPALRTGFSFAMSLMRPENADGRATDLLDALHHAVLATR